MIIISKPIITKVVKNDFVDYIYFFTTNQPVRLATFSFTLIICTSEYCAPY